jgi:hypothetical protein
MLKLLRLRPSFLAMLLACGLSLSATTIVPMSVEELTRASTNVVVAQAVDSHSEWNADKTLIFTITTFQVSESLKGEAAKTIVVRQMGGRVPNYEQKVAGVRHWQAGEQAVLFLRPSPAGDGTMAVAGLMQGDFRVIQSADKTIVSNGVPGVEAYDPSKHSTGEFSGTKMTLDDLRSRVMKATAP